MNQTTLNFEPQESARLGRQLQSVLSVMSDGRERTLDQIQKEMDVFASTPSISARLRQLRGMGYVVSRRKLGEGLYGYTVSK